MSDFIEQLLEGGVDGAADVWPQIVDYVRDVLGTSGMASLRDWAEADDDELAILSLVDCFAGYRKARTFEELRHKFGDDLVPAIGAAALVGFAGWQPCPEVPQ